METRLASPSKALRCHHQARKMIGQSGKAAGPASSTRGKAAAQGSTQVREQLLPCPVPCSLWLLCPGPSFSLPAHPEPSINYPLLLHRCFPYCHTAAPCLKRLWLFPPPPSSQPIIHQLSKPCPALSHSHLPVSHFPPALSSSSSLQLVLPKPISVPQPSVLRN